MNKTRQKWFVACMAALAAGACAAQVTPDTPDIPPHFAFPSAMFDYTVREVMVPMRDGVKSHTVIVEHKVTRNAPIVLTRTPYNASGIATGHLARTMREMLPASDDVLVDAGHIRIYQDVRGQYGSEGDYFMVDGTPRKKLAPVAVYDTGANHWDYLDHWPLACHGGCAVKSTPIHLRAGRRLAFAAPGPHEAKYGSHLSDPANPVPYRPWPNGSRESEGSYWALVDQRFVDGRPDVISYTSEPLAQPRQVSGAPW